MESKVKKLCSRLEKLINILNHSQYSSAEGLTRDRYYYIQKKEELILLEDEVQKATERIKVLNERIRVTHVDVFLNWRNDIRIYSRLNTLQREQYNELIFRKTIL